MQAYRFFAVVLLFMFSQLSIYGQLERMGACVVKDDVAVGMNENGRFPMYSLMKFPQAIYVASEMVRRKMSLDTQVLVRNSDLMHDTWSPMLREMPEERWFSYAELLAFSLEQSDNNACDILFREFGNPKRVGRFLHRLGFKQIHVKKTERQMHDNPSVSNRNWTTPKEMAYLSEWFYQHRDDNVYMQYLWAVMAECRTGADRIPAALPAGATIVHKTGTGYPVLSGPSGIADVGIILMPDGQVIPIAVFVEHPVNGSRIAEIAAQLMK